MKIEKKTAPSKLYITDLTNIDLSGLSVKSYGTTYGIRFVIDGVGLETKGHRWLDENNYLDYSETASAPAVLIIPKGTISPNIKSGDYITLSYDSKTLKVYLPTYNQNAQISFFIADDGSTYYDMELKNLAASSNIVSECTTLFSNIFTAANAWKSSPDDFTKRKAVNDAITSWASQC